MLINPIKENITSSGTLYIYLGLIVWSESDQRQRENED